VRAVLALPTVYEAWQAPFAAQKLAPFTRRIDPSKAGRVIDLGCGPGTNAAIFPVDQYLGVDISPKYIEHARQRHPHRFEVWDVTESNPGFGQFDLVLINSVFHHLSDQQTASVLRALPGYLRPQGTVHILDLVLPPDPGLPRALAKHDRGDFPRPIDDWQALIGSHLTLSSSEPFDVGLFGLAMWKMVFMAGTVPG
jgi:trans-aconitate methyltransferase